MRRLLLLISDISVLQSFKILNFRFQYIQRFGWVYDFASQHLNLVYHYTEVPSHSIPCSLHFRGHFIPKGKMCSLHPMLTSYLESLHTLSHFIFGVTAYPESLHTMGHFIPWVTPYRSHFIPLYFIPNALHNKPLHTKSLPSALHIKCFSQQVISYQVHLISRHLIRSQFVPKDSSCKCTSYQLI